MGYKLNHFGSNFALFEPLFTDRVYFSNRINPINLYHRVYPLTTYPHYNFRNDYSKKYLRVDPGYMSLPSFDFYGNTPLNSTELFSEKSRLFGTGTGFHTISASENVPFYFVKRFTGDVYSMLEYYRTLRRGRNRNVRPFGLYDKELVHPEINRKWFSYEFYTEDFFALGSAVMEDRFAGWLLDFLFNTTGYFDFFDKYSLIRNEHIHRSSYDFVSIYKEPLVYTFDNKERFRYSLSSGLKNDLELYPRVYNVFDNVNVRKVEEAGLLYFYRNADVFFDRIGFTLVKNILFEDFYNINNTDKNVNMNYMLDYKFKMYG